MSKIKILQIICRSGPGGGEKHLADLLAGLGKNAAYEVHVMAPKGIYYNSYAENVKSISDYRPERYCFIYNAVSAYRLVRDLKIDIIHTHLFPTNIIGLIAAWFSRKPLIVNMHADIRDNPGARLRKWLYFAVDKSIHRYYSRIIAVSEYIKKRLVQSGYQPEKIEVIYNGIAAPPVNITAMGKRGYVIGTIARLHKVKGQRYLIDATCALINRGQAVELWIVGEGDDREILEKLVVDLGMKERVKFWGHQSDIWPFLQAFDLFVFPSLSESMGISLVEAMLLKKPIIASNVGGIPEIINNGKNGLLVEAGDSEGLARSMERLIKDRKQAESLARQAKADAETKFTLKIMLENTCKLYDILTKKVTKR